MDAIKTTQERERGYVDRIFFFPEKENEYSFFSICVNSFQMFSVFQR